MSWLKELDDQSKNSGRDYVFKKMEGSVASKLAAFENKKDGHKTPAGRSRANSNTSRAASSDLYSIEANRLSRRTTQEEKPGNVASVVGDSFKKKLEGITGNLATKVQENEKKETVRGPAALAEAKKKIPQDVLDMIALSGADEEVAINDYLKKGILGNTTTWDDDELAKGCNDPELQKMVKEVRSAKHSPTSETVPVIDAPKAVVPNTSVEQPAKFETPIIVSKPQIPIEQAIPSPVKEDKVQEALQAETPLSTAHPASPKPTSLSFVVSSNGDVKDLQSAQSFEQKKRSEEFNAAQLPYFAN